MRRSACLKDRERRLLLLLVRRYVCAGKDRAVIESPGGPDANEPLKFVWRASKVGGVRLTHTHTSVRFRNVRSLDEKLRALPQLALLLADVSIYLKLMFIVTIGRKRSLIQMRRVFAFVVRDALLVSFWAVIYQEAGQLKW